MVETVVGGQPAGAEGFTEEHGRGVVAQVAALMASPEQASVAAMTASLLAPSVSLR